MVIFILSGKTFEKFGTFINVLLVNKHIAENKNKYDTEKNI